MFHTKICGVRTLSDIKSVADCRADAIGLNFFSNSVRFVDPDSDDVCRLSEAAEQAGLLRVGVFVNAGIETILQIATRVGLDAIQLHGDEPIGATGQLRSRTELPLIRAIKLPTGPLEVAAIASLAVPWSDAGCHLLLDADAGSAHGGSGKMLDWDSIRRWSQRYPDTSWTLAGGLDPQNIAKAITASGAKSVDVASGVEQPRGEKSHDLIEGFMQARQKSAI